MDQGILMMCKASAEKKLWYFGSFKIFLLQRGNWHRLCPLQPSQPFSSTKASILTSFHHQVCFSRLKISRASLGPAAAARTTFYRACSAPGDFSFWRAELNPVWRAGERSLLFVETLWDPPTAGEGLGVCWQRCEPPPGSGLSQRVVSSAPTVEQRFGVCSAAWARSHYRPT